MGALARLLEAPSDLSAEYLTTNLGGQELAGPAHYDEHLATGRSLPPETQIYIAMLSPMIGDRQSDDRTVASFDLIAWTRATLFAARAETPPKAELPAAKVQPDRSPSVRRIVDLSALSPQSEGLLVHLASGERPQ